MFSIEQCQHKQQVECKRLVENNWLKSTYSIPGRSCEFVGIFLGAGLRAWLVPLCVVVFCSTGRYLHHNFRIINAPDNSPASCSPTLMTASTCWTNIEALNPFNKRCRATKALQITSFSNAKPLPPLARFPKELSTTLPNWQLSHSGSVLPPVATCKNIGFLGSGPSATQNSSPNGCHFFCR